MDETPTGTARDRARARTHAEITRIGREHLARDGAAALSLRAVARDLGVVSSAIYRYVASRDDLLTLLVVDGYGDLADSVQRAVRPRHGPVERLHDTAQALRAWALAEPARWSLLYGSPVPGYTAPAEETNEPGTRVLRRVVADLEAAYAAGRIAPASDPRLPRALRADLRDIARESGVTLPEPVLARGVSWWSAVVGAVSGEVFGAWGEATFSDPAAVFTHHLRLLDEVLAVTRP